MGKCFITVIQFQKVPFGSDCQLFLTERALRKRIRWLNAFYAFLSRSILQYISIIVALNVLLQSSGEGKTGKYSNPVQILPTRSSWQTQYPHFISIYSILLCVVCVFVSISWQPHTHLVHHLILRQKEFSKSVVHIVVCRI